MQERSSKATRRKLKASLSVSSWQYLKHSIDIRRANVKVGRSPHPTSPRRSGDSGGFQPSDDFPILKTRFAEAHNPGSRLGRPISQNLISLSPNARSNP